MCLYNSFLVHDSIISDFGALRRSAEGGKTGGNCTPEAMCAKNIQPWVPHPQSLCSGSHQLQYLSPYIRLDSILICESLFTHRILLPCSHEVIEVAVFLLSLYSYAPFQCIHYGPVQTHIAPLCPFAQRSIQTGRNISNGVLSHCLHLLHAVCNDLPAYSIEKAFRGGKIHQAVSKTTGTIHIWVVGKTTLMLQTTSNSAVGTKFLSGCSVSSINFSFHTPFFSAASSRPRRQRGVSPSPSSVSFPYPSPRRSSASVTGSTESSIPRRVQTEIRWRSPGSTWPLHGGAGSSRRRSSGSPGPQSGPPSTSSSRITGKMSRSTASCGTWRISCRRMSLWPFFAGEFEQRERSE